MFEKPQAEHKWLESLLGDWEQEGSCDTGPDQPATIHKSTVHATSLHGMWVALEHTAKSPEGDGWTSIITLGYDPKQQRYVGTFIGSMMTHLWIYNGKMDDKGRLVLDAVGPKFGGEGMANYQDIIQIVSKDEWILSSRMQQDNGEWVDFMKATNKRV
jgi:Protein of unknown function (DUF1579).